MSQPRSNKIRFINEMRRLRRSMDFVSQHPSLLKDGAGELGSRVADIYQQLGLAWEFLGLQCRHWNGFRDGSNGIKICRICGKVKNKDDAWLLLPNNRRKIVGRRLLPSSKKTFATHEKARLLIDSIEFHGARLKVEVQNAYRSSLFGKDRDFTIAADRMVSLGEGDIECRLDTYTIHLYLHGAKARCPVPIGAFPWELPRKQLKKFPVILECDRRGRFVGLTLFRPPCARSHQTSQNNIRAEDRQAAATDSSA